MVNAEKGHQGWMVRHGYLSGIRRAEYSAWSAAKQRCTNPRNPAWSHYGGRGIRMDSEWLTSFESFLDHIGPKPDPSFTLDRIDNDGHYEPGNVRWTTYSEQIRNRRRTSHNWRTREVA